METGKDLQIGMMMYDGFDQLDLTGPFEVFSTLPHTNIHLVASTKDPVRDFHGLRLQPTVTFEDAPKLDVLHVPGGPGQDALMEHDETLNFIRRAAGEAKYVLSVCTGALLLGAAGLLRGRRATTHWAAFDLLHLLGAVAVNERVVVDGNWVFAAGVTSGIDGALMLARRLYGDDVAQLAQLMLQYQPEPPFACGTPETAPPDVFVKARASVADLTSCRNALVKKVALKSGFATPASDQ